MQNTTKVQRGQETLHNIQVPLKVWNKIGIELLGPLEEINDYKNIVTAVDHRSKSVEGDPLKTGEAEAEFLYKLLCWYGSCDTYITDQSREMVNSIGKEFYPCTGMHHHITSSYHPQINGLVKHQNTTEDCIQNM